MAIEDKIILESIVDYCNTLIDAVSEYSIDDRTLRENPAFRGMIAFFVQQVGECAKKLTDEFKKSHPEIDWKAMSGLRNRIVHAYGRIDVEILWDVVQNDIPELNKYCARVLEKC